MTRERIKEVLRLVDEYGLAEWDVWRRDDCEVRNKLAARANLVSYLESLKSPTDVLLASAFRKLLADTTCYVSVGRHHIMIYGYSGGLSTAERAVIQAIHDVALAKEEAQQECLYTGLSLSDCEVQVSFDLDVEVM